MQIENDSYFGRKMGKACILFFPPQSIAHQNRQNSSAALALRTSK